MAIGKQEVIKAAVQLERDGREFYLDLAKRASNRLSRRMFESLADDETRHIEWIENLSPGAKNAEAANRDIYGRLCHIFQEVPETEKQKAASQDDIKAVNLAVDMEEKSRLAYHRWMSESQSEEVRHLCKVLADAERFHRELLENTIEYLQRSGDWFMQEERWIFDGG